MFVTVLYSTGNPMCCQNIAISSCDMMFFELVAMMLYELTKGKETISIG